MTEVRDYTEGQNPQRVGKEGEITYPLFCRFQDTVFENGDLLSLASQCALLYTAWRRSHLLMQSCLFPHRKNPRLEDLAP